MIEEIIDFFRILKNNIVFLIIIVGLGAFTGFIFSRYVFTNHYSTQVSLSTVAPIEDETLNTYSAYLKSDSFTDTLKTELEKKSLKYSTKQLSDSMKMTTNNKSKTISVDISTTNKDLTFQLSQLIPKIFMSSATVSDDSLSSIAVYKSLTETKDPTLFEKYLEELLSDNFFVLDKKIEKNDIKESVRVKKNILMGALSGLVLFFFILLIKEFINDTVKNNKFVEEDLELPVLTTLKK